MSDMAFKVTEPHPLSELAALQRLKQFVAILRLRFADQVATVDREEWIGATLHYRFTGKEGRIVEGTVTATPNDATVQGTVTNVPWLAQGFVRSRVQAEVSQALKEALATVPPPDNSLL